MEIIGAEAETLSGLAKRWLSRMGKGGAFERLPVAVQRRCLQIQLIERGIPVDFELIEQLRESADRAVTLGPKLVVFRDKNGRLRIEEMDPANFDFGEKRLKLRGRAGEFGFDGLRIKWKFDFPRTGAFRAPKRSRDSENDSNFELFDAHKVGKQMVLRHWQPGDRFQPIGMKAPVKVQDLFTNQKIPRARRHELAVAVTAKGELFWVEGLRLGECFKLDAGTVQRLKWEWERTGEQDG
jgi:tRNA(Ile)-lysidine synthase